MDILLDLNTKDAVFFNGPLTPKYTTQPLTQTVEQRLRIRLSTFKGEWFMDTTYGIPYFQSILGKKSTKEAVDLIFQQAILAENGVKEVSSFTSTFTNRKYSMTFTVKVSNGHTTQPVTITP
ncbi:hypothetical protein [Pseudomonas sp.]|uniref:hypothetical protein n=1 Tax=Pseudomonas sp. TaxID=306 RepID=UPI003FD7DFC9